MSTLVAGGPFAPPAASVPGMSADKMRKRSASHPNWKKKQQEAKKNGTKCQAGKCNNKVGDPGVKALEIEHKFPAGRIWGIASGKQTVNQMRSHFTNPKNLILLCKRCNTSKGGKTYNQWAQDRPDLISPKQAADLQKSAREFQQMLLKL